MAMAIETVGLGFPPKWRRTSASLTFSPSMIIHSFSRKSVSCEKLPRRSLRLTIRKLDRSSFHIEVMKGATVAQLKEAVEDFFSDLPRKGPEKISWSLVWGNFCLCFAGQKLLSDELSVNDYRIRDGDQRRLGPKNTLLTNSKKRLYVVRNHMKVKPRNKMKIGV